MPSSIPTVADQQGKPLVDEQIEVLQKLPTMDLALGPRARSIAERLTTGTDEKPFGIGLTFLNREGRVHLTNAGEVLLATVLQRQREIDELKAAILEAATALNRAAGEKAKANDLDGHNFYNNAKNSLYAVITRELGDDE